MQNIYSLLQKTLVTQQGCCEGMKYGIRVLHGTKHERCCGWGRPSNLFKGR